MKKCILLICPFCSLEPCRNDSLLLRTHLYTLAHPVGPDTLGNRGSGKSHPYFHRNRDCHILCHSRIHPHLQGRIITSDSVTVKGRHSWRVQKNNTWATFANRCSEVPLYIGKENTKDNTKKFNVSTHTISEIVSVLSSLEVFYVRQRFWSTVSHLFHQICCIPQRHTLNLTISVTYRFFQCSIIQSTTCVKLNPLCLEEVFKGMAASMMQKCCTDLILALSIEDNFMMYV